MAYIDFYKAGRDVCLLVTNFGELGREGGGSWQGAGATCVWLALIRLKKSY